MTVNHSCNEKLKKNHNLQITWVALIASVFNAISLLSVSVSQFLGCCNQSVCLDWIYIMQRHFWNNWAFPFQSVFLRGAFSESSEESRNVKELQMCAPDMWHTEVFLEGWCCNLSFQMKTLTGTNDSKKQLAVLPLGIPSRCCSFVKPLKVAFKAWDIISLLPGVSRGTSPHSGSANHKEEYLFWVTPASVRLEIQMTNITCSFHSYWQLRLRQCILYYISCR